MNRLLLFRYFFIALAGFAAFLVACNKEKLFTPSSEGNTTVTDSPVNFEGLGWRTEYDSTTEETNYETYLNTAAHGIISLSRDSAFRNLVYQEALKAFDEDDNVLLRNLDSLWSGTDMAQSFRSSIQSYDGNLVETSNPLLTKFQSLSLYTDTSNVQKAIRGVDYFDEKGFIQIYLPFIENTDLSKKPVIAIGLDSNDDTGIGFSPQADGSYEVITVDEAFAENYPVWIISVNETFDSEVALSEYLANGGFVSNPESFGPCPDSKSIRVDSFFIQALHEGFFGGKADVSIVGRQARGCVYTSVINFVPFRKVKNNELCKWLRTKQPKIHLAFCDPTNTDYQLSSDERIGLIFYESDNRRKWEKTYQLPGCTQTMSWVSKHDEYGALWSDALDYADISNSTPYVFQFFLDWRPNVMPGSNTCGVGNPEGALQIWGGKN